MPGGRESQPGPWNTADNIKFAGMWALTVPAPCGGPARPRAVGPCGIVDPLATVTPVTADFARCRILTKASTLLRGTQARAALGCASGRLTRTEYDRYGNLPITRPDRLRTDDALPDDLEIGNAPQQSAQHDAQFRMGEGRALASV